MSKKTNNLSIWEEEYSGRRRVCMLMITHACNLNCSYCYESHKQNAYMTVELAKKIISQEAKMVAESDKFDEIQIDFMGGEPLMNFELIKEIVEWLENGNINVPWICFASTNATLINHDIKEWLKKHKQYMILGASYDGTGQMQSSNRGTDQYNIDLDFFHELWPEQTFQMTISKETLPYLAEGVLYVQHKGYEINASLAQGVDWTKEDAQLYREQLCILKDAYLQDIQLSPLNRLTRYVDVFNLAPSEHKQIHRCGSGLNMITYDVDGKRYGCHMFTPIVLGTKRAIGVDAIEWDKPGLMADSFCVTCVLRRFCPTCPGFNYKYREDFASRDKRWCPLVLAEAMTACEFQIERISMIDKLSVEDAEHAQTAIKAYNILQQLDLENSVSPYKI
jgi:uncharacterized protein